MPKIREIAKEEKGSVSLEFLTVLPYYLFFFLILWQVVASGLTFMKAQSAVNEAAKVYSVTSDTVKAKEIAEDILGYSDIMQFKEFKIKPGSAAREFEAELTYEHGLIFIPKDWRKKATLTFTQSVDSRVIK